MISTILNTRNLNLINLSLQIEKEVIHILKTLFFLPSRLNLFISSQTPHKDQIIIIIIIAKHLRYYSQR